MYCFEHEDYKIHWCDEYQIHIGKTIIQKQKEVRRKNIEIDIKNQIKEK